MAQQRNAYRTLSVQALVVLFLAGLGVQVWFTSTQLAAEVYRTQGTAAQRERRLEIALNDYERAEAFYGHDARVLYLLGVLKKELGDSEAASDALRRSLALTPNEVPTIIAYAELLALSGDLQRAEEVLGRALELVPANWGAVHVAGLIRGLDGDAAGAAEHFEQALKLSGNADARLLNQLANALFTQGRYAEALRHVDRAIARQEIFPDHHLIRGKIMLALGNVDEAARALGWAERMYVRREEQDRPDAAKLHDTRRNLYQVHLKRSQLQKAAETLALMAASQGATEEVTGLVVDLESRLDNLLGHSDGLAQFSLGKALLAVDRFRSAEQALIRAIRATPKSMRETISILRAQAFLGYGRPAEALATLEVIDRPVSPNLEYLITLGDARAGTGDLGGAREAYAVVLENFDLSNELRRYVEAKRNAL